jgi:hypothetical protein
MSPETKIMTRSTHRCATKWKQLLDGVLAVTLLLPAPIFAGTWAMGNWMPINQPPGPAWGVVESQSDSMHDTLTITPSTSNSSFLIGSTFQLSNLVGFTAAANDTQQANFTTFNALSVSGTMTPNLIVTVQDATSGFKFIDGSLASNQFSNQLLPNMLSGNQQTGMTAGIHAMLIRFDFQISVSWTQTSSPFVITFGP